MTTKNGFDDYLVHFPRESFVALKAAARAPTKPPKAAQPHREAAAAAESGKGFLEAPDDPHKWGRKVLEGPEFEHPSRCKLGYWQEQFYLWSGGAYEPVPAPEFRARTTRKLRKLLEDQAKLDYLAWQANGGKDDPPEVIPVTGPLVRDVVQAIAGETVILGSKSPPTWLAFDEEGEDPPAPAGELLAVANGLLHVPAAAQRRPGELLPHTPRFFTLNKLPYKFDPHAPAPARWLKFVNEVFPNDPDSRRLLQQWFGYCLTPWTSLDKLMLLVGASRGGKGVIFRTLGHLLGAANVGTFSLMKLADRFGLEGLLGKTVAIDAEAGTPGKEELAQVTSIVKAISGSDPVCVFRKGKTSLDVHLPVRLMIGMNRMPTFKDPSGGVANRLLMLRFDESFAGREDRGLQAALAAEVGGILNWAIDGYADLRAAGEFMQPEAGRDLLDEMSDAGSAISVFVREQCGLDPNAREKTADLYARYRDWCADRGRSPDIRETFVKDLLAHCPKLRSERPREDGKRSYVYVGIGLKPLPRAAEPPEPDGRGPRSDGRRKKVGRTKPPQLADADAEYRPRTACDLDEFLATVGR